jgi:hypothetical protein
MVNEMLTIQCTKKLINELKIDLSNQEPIESVPLYSWHSHLFVFNRKKCVIVMNNLTRYNFILTGLKKAEFIKYDQIVAAAIAENLLAEGASENTVDDYMKHCSSAIYRTASDRSIISQMNEMIMAAELWMSKDKYNGIETNMPKLNRRLNHFVMLKLPKCYSGVTVLEELERLE